MDNELDNEVTVLLEELYNTIADAKSSTFGGRNKCQIDRENALSLLNSIRDQFPIEFSEAKRLVSAKDEYIANAKREGETIRRNAEEQAKRLVDETEITRAAKAQASEMMTRAEQKSRELMKAANDYVDDAMRRTEEAIAAAQNEVQQSRARFRSLAGARQNLQPQAPQETAQAAPQEAPEEPEE